MNPVATTNEQEKPKWRQWQSQIAFLVLVAITIVAISVGLMAAKAIHSQISSDDQQDINDKAAEMTRPTEDLMTSPTGHPTGSPSRQRLPTPMPSANPTLKPSPKPTFSSHMPSHSNPTASPEPSVTPTMRPSRSKTPSLHSPDVIGLYVMGDTPYAPWEELMLVSQLAEMAEYMHPTAMFTVHLGDVQKPARSLCVEFGYFMAAQYLKAGPLTTFVLAGDNDWADCPNMTEGLGYYHKYFDYFERNWITSAAMFPMQVEHNATYPEMWRFIYKNVLLISVQLIDSQNVMPDWDVRMTANIRWMLTALDQTPLSAVVIFGQGQVGNETREFFEGIRPAFLGARRSIPVMYIHGDGHVWELSDKIQTQLNWASFIDVQVDQGAYADPIILEISTDLNAPLRKEHDLQYVFGNGVIRIDRQRGRYPVGSDGRPDISKMQQFPLH